MQKIEAMADNDWKKRLGVVFSTNPDFQFETAEETEPDTPAPSAQKLTVRIDRSGRAGKQVTLIQGFRGKESDLAELGKTLKIKLGIGGSAKDGEIVLQGDFRDRALSLLESLGYKAKRGN